MFLHCWNNCNVALYIEPFWCWQLSLSLSIIIILGFLSPKCPGILSPLAAYFFGDNLRGDSQTTDATILTDAMSLLQKVKIGMGSPDWHVSMFDIHLCRILWVYRPGHAGVKGNDSAVQFKMVCMHSGRPICAPPRLSGGNGDFNVPVAIWPLGTMFGGFGRFWKKKKNNNTNPKKAGPRVPRPFAWAVVVSGVLFVCFIA